MRSLYVLAWRTLSANRLRGLLTVLAVSFGVAATIAGNIIAQSTRKALLKSDDMRTIMEGIISQLDPMMAIISVVVMAAAAFLIFNAFAMSVTQRRQQIGALRSLGMTRSQIMRLMLTEALFVSIVGIILGLIGGPLIGKLSINLITEIGGGMFLFEESSAALWSVVLAIVLGLGMTWLAVYFPARRATRISPLDALRKPDAENIGTSSRRNTLAGIVILSALALHLVFAPPGEWVLFPADATLAALFIAAWLLALGLLLPAFIGLIGNRARKPLSRFFGASGRLMADNLQRGRRRVTLTVITLAFGLMVITSLTGFLDFMVATLFGMSMEQGIESFYVAKVDPSGGLGALAALDPNDVLLTDEEYAAVLEAAEDKAYILVSYFVVVPELSFLGNAYFSYVMDFAEIRRVGTGLITFTEGDWETALSNVESGCTVLVSPLVAAKNNAGLGDVITVSAKNGPVDCTIGGIGSIVANASIINIEVGEEFGITTPALALLTPRPGSNFEETETSLSSVLEQYPGLAITTMRVMMDVQREVTGLVSTSFNFLLLLAVMAAALGVVNTTMMSVDERRRELLLLRAIGTTQKQVRAVIMGEAALMGLIGGVFGFVAGVGFVLIFVVTYGGNSWGLTFPLWSTALAATQPALFTGFIGLVAAPIISALAAWLPTRKILHGKIV